jgi:hypothetical protein
VISLPRESFRFVILMLLSAIASTGATSLSGRGQQSDASDKGSRKLRSFKLDLMTEGKTPDGRAEHTDRFVTREGTRVYLESIKFDSSQDASAMVRNFTKSAQKILESGAKIDKTGAPVGIRIIALFASTEKSPAGIGVFWNQGSLFNAIYATSREDAADFEVFMTTWPSR